MGLRITTAMSLALAAGVLAACDDDEDVSAVETTDDVVIAEEAPVVVEEEPVEAELAETEGELDAAVTTAGNELEEAGDAIGEAASDAGAAVVAGAETLANEAEEAGDAIATGTANLVEGAEQELNELEAEIDTAATEAEIEAREETLELADTAEDLEAGAPVVADPDTPLAEAADGDVANTLETTEVATAETATGDDVIVLENNVTTVGEVDTADATLNAADGEADAEALVTQGASQAANTEELNDVATDGIDSGSELAMIDFDDLVLDQEGVERLTSFIEDSDQLTATQKVTLVAGLDAARDDPERLQQLLEQVQEAMLIDTEENTDGLAEDG